MINLKNKASLIIIIIINLFIFSCGDIIEGRVAMKGNDPHTYLSIVTEEGQEFKIVGKLEKEIATKYQGNTIKVKGIIIEEGIGPGFPPHFEVLKIIEYQ